MGRHSSSTESDSSAREKKSTKRHRKEKKRKDKDHKKKKHKHNKRPETDSERDKRLVKEAKKFLKQKLRDGHPVNPPGSSLVPLAQTSSEPRPLPPGVETLSEEADYFVRNAEFSAWLSQDLGLYFNELSSEDARTKFSHFVQLWNTGRLALHIYTAGTAGSAQPPAKRTGFNWNIQGATAAATAEAEEEREARALAGKAQRKRDRVEAKEWLDEMLPKATGREAQVEKKRALREDRAAAEAVKDEWHVTADVMGGAGDDSFAAAKRREEMRMSKRGAQQAQRDAVLESRLAEAQAKEEDKMAQFRALLAASGGSVQIQKRQ